MLRWLTGRTGYRRLSEPKTDLQARLRYIEDRCDSITNRSNDADVKELAYLVGYIAKIVEIHFQTGEG